MGEKFKTFENEEDTKAAIDESGEQNLYPYEWQEGCWVIALRQREEGLKGKKVVEALKVGTEIKVRTEGGKFVPLKSQIHEFRAYGSKLKLNR